jgi:hypothetical protein
MQAYFPMSLKALITRVFLTEVHIKHLHIKLCLLIDDTLKVATSCSTKKKKKKKMGQR